MNSTLIKLLLFLKLNKYRFITYWIFFSFEAVFFFNFNFFANVFNKNPTIIIPAKTIAGIIYLNELGKNKKYFL